MIPTLYEPLSHWSDGGSVYILSDLHFDDEDCKFMSPDWQEYIVLKEWDIKEKLAVGIWWMPLHFMQ